MSLRTFFKGVSLEIEDLFLLETFQIDYFPGYVPERELAAVLWAYPAIERYLVKRCPPVSGFVQKVMAEHGPAADEEELTEFERVVEPGGYIIHCPGTADIPSEEAQHQRLVSPDWGYSVARYKQPDGWKRKYWKQRGKT
jgi:hypothetical protein